MAPRINCNKSIFVIIRSEILCLITLKVQENCPWAKNVSFFIQGTLFQYVITLFFVRISKIGL